MAALTHRKQSKGEAARVTRFSAGRITFASPCAFACVSYTWLRAQVGVDGRVKEAKYDTERVNVAREREHATAGHQ